MSCFLSAKMRKEGYLINIQCAASHWDGKDSDKVVLFMLLFTVLPLSNPVLMSIKSINK